MFNSVSVHWHLNQKSNLIQCDLLTDLQTDTALIMIMLDSAGRKRTLSCSTTATAHSSASSYTSYNMDADDADHMIYLESR